jgi:hypothetical protein
MDPAGDLDGLEPIGPTWIVSKSLQYTYMDPDWSGLGGWPSLGPSSRSKPLQVGSKRLGTAWRAMIPVDLERLGA